MNEENRNEIVEKILDLDEKTKIAVNENNKSAHSIMSAIIDDHFIQLGGMRLKLQDIDGWNVYEQIVNPDTEETQNFIDIYFTGYTATISSEAETIATFLDNYKRFRLQNVDIESLNKEIEKQERELVLLKKQRKDINY